jgi:hypothetical protein
LSGVCPEQALKEIMRRMKQKGKDISVYVRTEGDAEKVLLGYITSEKASEKGRFRNTTDQILPSGKKSSNSSGWLPGVNQAYDKKGTYHYDKADINAKPGDHALIGDHIQIHTYEGKTIRIFYGLD